MNAIETLVSVLCDPEGKCCISGSDDDRRLIDSALAELTQALRMQQAQSAGPCAICGSDEPFTGTCGSGDPRALCQQAAPKAAPGEPSDYQIRAITTAYEQGVGKGHQAYISGKETANPYDSPYRCDLAWQYGYREGKEQAQRGVKAAPGVGNSGFDHQTAADFLSGKTVSDEAVRKFVAESRWVHNERAALSATLLAMHGVLTSREAEIALLKKALMEAEAAPKQQAREPLTDAQIAEMMRDTWGCASIAPRHALEFARAVERVHGITQKGGSNAE